MDAKEFDIYTERLRTTLESAAEVIGLVALGTTVESKLRDEWSDHDFWVITEAEAQDSLLKDLSVCVRAAQSRRVAERASIPRLICC